MRGAAISSVYRQFVVHKPDYRWFYKRLMRDPH
jgi:hypothetical protein